MRKLLFSELSDIIAIYVDVPLHNKMSSKTRTAFFGFRQTLCFAAILESKKKNSREIISKIFFPFIWKCSEVHMLSSSGIEWILIFFLSGAPSVFF